MVYLECKYCSGKFEVLLLLYSCISCSVFGGMILLGSGASYMVIVVAGVECFPDCFFGLVGFGHL